MRFSTASWVCLAAHTLTTLPIIMWTLIMQVGQPQPSINRMHLGLRLPQVLIYLIVSCILNGIEKNQHICFINSNG